MAATPSLASRAAFAELLDDHWRIFRDQLLEAIPENQQAQAEVASWDKDGYENLVQIAEGALPTRSRTSGSGSEGASGSISPGGVSQVPSLPEITPKPLATHLEASNSFGSQQTMLQVDSVGLSCAQRANVGYLQSSLDNLPFNEARAIRHRLRVRLGAMSKLKMVSGQSLHDAVQALGLTRYSVEEMNDLVNLLADFINLNFKEDEQSKRRRRQTIFSWEEDHDYGSWSWDWPQIKEVSARMGRAGSMASMSVMSEKQASSTYNVAPASVLMELFLAQDSDVHKRIFGFQTYKQFLAMREILLAGDTNRLVAELTFVRINDLAAPPEPTHPLMYVEPFVALLIVANGIMIGFQTEPTYQVWDGWPIIECVFAGFLVLEIILRMHLLGCRTFWCGDDYLWNLFDVLLGITGVTDVTVELANQRRSEIPTSLLRFCRLIRLVRIVKVFRLKFMKDLRLMVKGLVAGIRTLTLAFTLLLSVIYVISGFATYTIGRSRETEELELAKYFRNLPLSMFTAFRCFTGECTNDLGYPMTSMLAQKFGLPFVACYIMSYMLVSMGIFNVILAVYVEITMKAAKETEATTAEQHARESIRVARTTRELLKKFAAAYRIFQELEECEGHQQVTRLEFRGGSTIFTDDDVHDKIAITKELFLLVIQDRDVQRLMDELDLPPDRANLFEGLLQIRGEIKKSDTVAALLATKAVQHMVADIREGYEKHFKELKGTLEAELQKLKPAIPQRYHPRVANV